MQREQLKFVLKIKVLQTFVYTISPHALLGMVGIEPTNRSNKLFTTLHRAGEQN